MMDKIIQKMITDKKQKNKDAAAVIITKELTVVRDAVRGIQMGNQIDLQAMSGKSIEHHDIDIRQKNFLSNTNPLDITSK